MTKKELHSKITKAKNSSFELLQLNSSQRKAILLHLAKNISESYDQILIANQKDIDAAKKNLVSESFQERMTLTKDGLKSSCNSIKEIARSHDSLFEILESKKMLSGISIQKTRVPLGLTAMIYESRPNVTIDAFSMAFKSGNSIILKGGKEIRNTNAVIICIIRNTLKNFKVNTDVIQDFSGINKDEVMDLISNTQIDCLIPRGGKNLIDFVKNNAKVPVIITGASIVHTYVDKSADIEMAAKVITNAKTRRVSICNALDVLLLHKEIYKKLLRYISPQLSEKNLEIRADNKSFSFLKEIGYKKLSIASENDFETEFLRMILAIKIVPDFDSAIKHIQKHSLGHSEAIITKSKKQAEKFFKNIDAACLYLNTSTQFSDGGEFGMGGEIGISTQKLHARGPFSYRELTTYKYIVQSDGSIRN